MITIEIPQFITRVKMSDRSRKTYYRKHVDRLPIKYETERYIWKKFGRFQYLYDTVEEERVVKNIRTLGVPKYETIAGNTSYAGWHPAVRSKLIEEIKDSFRPHLANVQPITETPIRISMQIHTVPGACDWDLDNLWIYHKAFGDLLQQEGLIRNDNILNITANGGIEFYPVNHPDERKMIFIIEPETRPVIKNHIMYNSGLQASSEIDIDEVKFSYIRLIEDTEIDAGKIDVQEASNSAQTLITINACIGKRSIIYGALNRVLKKVYNKAIQYNLPVIITPQFLKRYSGYVLDTIKKQVEEHLSKRGIKVYYIKDEHVEEKAGSGEELD